MKLAKNLLITSNNALFKKADLPKQKEIKTEKNETIDSSSETPDVSQIISEAVQSLAEKTRPSIADINNIIDVLRKYQIPYELKTDKSMVHLNFTAPDGKNYSLNICLSGKINVQKYILESVRDIINKAENGSIDSATAKNKILELLDKYGITPDIDDSGTISFNLNGKSYSFHIPNSSGIKPDNETETEPESETSIETETENGILLSKTTKDNQGRPIKYEKFDYNGNIVYTVTYTYNADGSHKEVTTDASGKVIEETEVNKDGNKTSKTVFDSEERIQKKEQYSDGQLTQTVAYTYNADGSHKEVVTDASGTVLEEIEVDKDGNITSRTVYEWIDEELGFFKAVIYDGSGNVTGYKECGELYFIKELSSIGNLYSIKSDKALIIRDAEGNPISAVLYNCFNETEVEATVTFDTAPDGRKRRTVRQTVNGRVVVRTAYDSGNGLYNDTYSNKLKNNDKVLQGQSTKTIYNVISNMTDKEYSLRMIRSMMRESLPNTVKFLELADPNYTGGLPSGCTKVNSYADSPYASFLQQIITSNAGSYGYEPEEIVGYEFGESSDISKQVAKNSKFLNYIKSNYSRLAAGYTADSISGAMSFNFGSSGDSDLANSIGQAYIVHSEVDANGNLHLTLADVYDFNQSAWNDGSGLNAAGIAAMQNGALVPYFELINIVIPASQLK